MNALLTALLTQLITQAGPELINLAIRLIKWTEDQHSQGKTPILDAIHKVFSHKNQESS